MSFEGLNAVRKKWVFNYCGVRAIWKGFPASPCLEGTRRLVLLFHLHMSPVTFIWIITEWSLFTVTFPTTAPVVSAGCERSSHLLPHCTEHVCGCHETFQPGKMLMLTLISQHRIFYGMRNLKFTSLSKKNEQTKTKHTHKKKQQTQFDGVK